MNASSVTKTLEIDNTVYSATAEFRRADGVGDNATVNLGTAGFTGNRSGNGTGIFGTPLTQSWRAYQRGGNAGRSAGAYVTGLPPGEYDVYAVVHNPVLIASGRSTNVGIGVGAATSGSIAWNDASLTGTSFAASPQTDTWELGVNYARVRVTVTAENPNIYVIQGGPAAGNDAFDFHTLTAVQIVAVVEEGGEFESWMADNYEPGQDPDEPLPRGGMMMSPRQVYIAGLDPQTDDLFRVYWDEQGILRYWPDLEHYRIYTIYWTDDLTVDPEEWNVLEEGTQLPSEPAVFFRVEVQLSDE